MADFTAILPPPQSIETLDSWGALDSLPFSLDSSVWEKAGKYALAVQAGAPCGGALAGGVRRRGIVGTSTAVTGGAMLGVCVTYLTLTDSAAMGGGVAAVRQRQGGGASAVAAGGDAGIARVFRLSGAAAAGGREAAAAVRVRGIAHAPVAGTTGQTERGLRIRQDAVPGAAAGDEISTWIRYRESWLSGAAITAEEAAFEHEIALLVTEPAVSGGEMNMLRVRLVDGGADSVMHGIADDYLVRCIMADGAALTGEAAEPWRVLPLSGSAGAAAGGEIFPCYKGWGWRQEAGGSADWRGVVVDEQGWRQEAGGSADWRGVVQWQ